VSEQPAAMTEARLSPEDLEQRLDVLHAAKAFAELEPITRDLPYAATVGASAVVPRDDLVAGASGPSSSIAIMSGVDRRGEWVVPARHRAVAVMGGVRLDLTRSRFTSAETTIQVFALWGGVEVIVPEDLTVHVEGIGIMGAFDHKAPARTPARRAHRPHRGRRNHGGCLGQVPAQAQRRALGEHAPRRLTGVTRRERARQTQGGLWRRTAAPHR
jgi:hypothetical protein